MKNVGIIFKQTLWDSRMGIASWGIGLGLLAMGEVFMFPSLSRAFADLTELLESPLYRALLGESADAVAFATPAGFLAVYMVAFVPVYLATYAVILGLGITAGEEERGTIDVLLGTPVRRWQVIAEKFAAIIVTLGLILLLNSLGAVIGILLTPEMQAVTPLRLLEGTLAMLPVTLVMVGLALFFSTALRSRNLAAGITGAIIIASYFVTTLSEVATEALGAVKNFSFYSYYSPMEIMQKGIVWPEFMILCLLAAVLFGLALFAFQRRDLAV